MVLDGSEYLGHFGLRDFAVPGTLFPCRATDWLYFRTLFGLYLRRMKIDDSGSQGLSTRQLLRFLA